MFRITLDRLFTSLVFSILPEVTLWRERRPLLDCIFFCEVILCSSLWNCVFVYKRRPPPLTGDPPYICLSDLESTLGALSDVLFKCGATTGPGPLVSRSSCWVLFNLSSSPPPTVWLSMNDRTSNAAAYGVTSLVDMTYRGPCESTDIVFELAHVRAAICCFYQLRT